MKKSKGFTLIELLAVIVIVGILITLVSIGVAKYVKTSKEKVKVQAAEEIIEIAKAYMATNNVYAVDVKTLIDEGYLAKDATNPKTGKNDIALEDFYVVECSNCKKTDAFNNGYSGDKFYLSLDSSINNLLSEKKDDSSLSISIDEKGEITLNSKKNTTSEGESLTIVNDKLKKYIVKEYNSAGIFYDIIPEKYKEQIKYEFNPKEDKTNILFYDEEKNEIYMKSIDDKENFTDDEKNKAKYLAAANIIYWYNKGEESLNLKYEEGKIIHPDTLEIINDSSVIKVDNSDSQKQTGYKVSKVKCINKPIKIGSFVRTVKFCYDGYKFNGKILYYGNLKK